MKRALPLLAALAIAAALLSACGKSTKTVTETTAGGQVRTEVVHDVHFAKTKFVLHVGLALGAFHRYIYKPLRAGGFHAGAPGRLRAFVKAAAASVFIVHELRVARADALADSHLRPLANRLDGLLASFAGLGGRLRAASLDSAGILGASAALGSLTQASHSAGAAVKELPATVGA